MKRLTAILLLAVAGLLAACTSPASSPGSTTPTLPVDTSPGVSLEPSPALSSEPSMEVSASPSTLP